MPVVIDILCTNDDGYLAAGFFPLVHALSQKYSVAVVAPETPMSWVGKSVTAHRPLTLRSVELNGIPIHVVDGTPADCVQIGLYEVLAQRPRLMLSGINIGANAGYARILSSGTVGAAIEAAIDGVPAVASSLDLHPDDRGVDLFAPEAYGLFEAAAALTVSVVDRVLAGPWDESTHVVNVNVPGGARPDAECVATSPFVERYGRLFERDGDVLRHRTSRLPTFAAEEGTDLAALQQGKVSASPLNFGLLNPRGLATLRTALQSPSRR